MGRKRHTNQSTKIFFKRLCCTCTIKVTRVMTRAPWPWPAARGAVHPALTGSQNRHRPNCSGLAMVLTKPKLQAHSLTLVLPTPGNNFIFAMFTLFLNERSTPPSPAPIVKNVQLRKFWICLCEGMDSWLSQNANVQRRHVIF